jgi:hypothetical protein
MTRKRTSDNDLVVSGGGAAAPVRRKAAARPRAKRAAETVETPAALAAEPQIVAPQADAAVSVYTPSYEEVAALAYSYWEARGCQGGSSDDDWRRAEQELFARSNGIIL